MEFKKENNGLIFKFTLKFDSTKGKWTKNKIEILFYMIKQWESNASVKRSSIEQNHKRDI